MLLFCQVDTFASGEEFVTMRLLLGVLTLQFLALASNWVNATTDGAAIEELLVRAELTQRMGIADKGSDRSFQEALELVEQARSKLVRAEGVATGPTHHV
jgi:hypothetical protein